MIYGICGFKGVGKDTVGKYFVNRGYIKLSFGDVLKDVSGMIFGWDRKMLEGDSVESRIWREKEDKWWSKKLGMKITPRIVLQKIGTDIFRENFHSDIWKLVIEKKLIENRNKNMVITDCRFVNEMNLVKKYGGKIICVHRNKPDWFDDYRDYKIDNIGKDIHKSELEWIRYRYDYEILNDGNIEDLAENIKKIDLYI
jgi:hypothetical protein